MENNEIYQIYEEMMAVVQDHYDNNGSSEDD